MALCSFNKKGGTVKRIGLAMGVSLLSFVAFANTTTNSADKTSDRPAAEKKDRKALTGRNANGCHYEFMIDCDPPPFSPLLINVRNVKSTK